MNIKDRNLEIIQSLASLYPLKDFEEEAILNIVNGVEPVKELNDYPVDDDRSDYEYSCPNCGWNLYYEQAGCTHCGCRIKWE